MFSADQQTCVVFNGEIYNFRELRADLKKKKYQFKTDSDTEVLLYLYQEYKENMLGYINGMFAFAIYDKKDNNLFIARDRMGQKPLFYFETQNTFVFASELQALKIHPEMPKNYNLNALHNELSLLYIPAPLTIYNDVFKLMPAHYININLNTAEYDIIKYWNIDFNKKTTLNFQDAKSKLREIVTESVKKRMISDVPYGAFLSGGIDSTIITGLMTTLTNDKIEAFSIGFNSSLYDETKFAQLAVEHFNQKTEQIIHYKKSVETNDINILRKVLKHCGEPYSDASILPSYMLSQWTKKNVTVALSGDGADELFGGYDRYFVIKLSQYINIIPFQLRNKVLNLLSLILPKKIEERELKGKIQRILNIFSQRKNHQYLYITNRFPEELKNRLYGEQFRNLQLYMQGLSSNLTAHNYVEKFMELDLNNYLHNDILTKVDISSMANSLEVRSPFLDYNVVEFALSLPLKYKLKGKTSKYILKETFKDLLPKTIQNRPKAGFGVPIAEWFRNDWKNILKMNLLEGISIKHNYFKKQEVEKIINLHLAKKVDYSYPLWAMLTFEFFLQNEEN